MANVSLTVTVSDIDIQAECSDKSVISDRLELDEYVKRFFGEIEKAFQKSDIVRTCDLITFGEALYRSFFPVEIANKLDSLIDNLAENECVKIFLHIKPVHLSVYPFEFLYHPKRKYFLCRNQQLTLNRYKPLSQPYKPAPVNPPLRILSIVCNPANFAQGHFQDKEYINEVQKASSINNDESKLLYNPAVTEVKKEAATGKYQIINFLGHGDFIDNQGLLIFVNNGVPCPEPVDSVVDAFTASSNIRLILLSACRSGKQSFYDPFSSVAMKLIETNKPSAVAGMQYPISVKDARTFSEAFYKEIALGASIDRAMQKARAELPMNSQTKDYLCYIFGAPMLFLRTNEKELRLCKPAPTTGHDHRSGHSNQQVSDRGMRNQSRLKKKIDDLNRQWELLNGKLSKLKEQFILETRSEEKFRLEKLIDDTKTQCDQVEEQLKDMESQLAKVGSDAKEGAGRNYDQGPTTYIPVVTPRYEEYANKTFVGRQFVFDDLDRFLDNHKCGYFHIRGEAGIGKTAIMANWVKKRGYIYHFNNVIQSINTPDQFLKAICNQLINKYNLHLSFSMESHGYSGDFLNNVLQQVGEILKETGKKEVILVDALDEVMKSERGRPKHGANVLFLPVELPEKIYFVLTSRFIKIPLTVSVEKEEFEIFGKDENNLIDVRAFLKDEIVKKEGSYPPITEELSQRGISQNDFIEQIIIKSKGNFLYLIYLLPELRKSDFYKPLEFNCLPDGLDGFYENFLNRLKCDDEFKWIDYYEPVLSVLTVAQEAFTIRQMSNFTEVQERYVKLAINTFRELLHVEKSGISPAYRIYHTSFQDFLGEGERIQKAGYHLKIAETYVKNCKDWDKVKELYPLRYVPFHFFEAGSDGYKGLCRIVDDKVFREVKLDRLNVLKPMLDDVRYGLLGALREDDLPYIVKYSFLYSKIIKKGRQKGSVLEFALKHEYDKAIDRAMLYQNESVRFKFLLLIADVAGGNGDFIKVEEVVKTLLAIPIHNDYIGLPDQLHGVIDMDYLLNEHYLLVNVLDWLIKGESELASELFLKIHNSVKDDRHGTRLIVFIIKRLQKKFCNVNSELEIGYLEQLISLSQVVISYLERQDEYRSYYCGKMSSIYQNILWFILLRHGSFRNSDVLRKIFDFLGSLPYEGEFFNLIQSMVYSSQNTWNHKDIMNLIKNAVKELLKGYLPARFSEIQDIINWLPDDMTDFSFEVFKELIDTIESCHIDATKIISIIASMVALFDRKWSREVLMNLLDAKRDDPYDLTLIASELICVDRDWGKHIFEEALQKAKNTDLLSKIASSLALFDRDWSRRIFKDLFDRGLRASEDISYYYLIGWHEYYKTKPYDLFQIAYELDSSGYFIWSYRILENLIRAREGKKDEDFIFEVFPTLGQALSAVGQTKWSHQVFNQSLHIAKSISVAIDKLIDIYSKQQNEFDALHQSIALAYIGRCLELAGEAEWSRDVFQESSKLKEGINDVEYFSSYSPIAKKLDFTGYIYWEDITTKRENYPRNTRYSFRPLFYKETIKEIGSQDVDLRKFYVGWIFHSNTCSSCSVRYEYRAIAPSIDEEYLLASGNWDPQIFFENLLKLAEDLTDKQDKSKFLSCITHSFFAIEDYKIIQKFIPKFHNDRDKAVVVSAYLFALAKKYPSKAVEKLKEIMIVDVRMDCIQRLKILFKNKKENLKSLILHAVEDAEIVDTVLADLIPCYNDEAQLIETAKVLGVESSNSRSLEILV